MTNVEAAKQAIKAQVEKNAKKGWGNDDSLRVIIAVIANETGANISELGEIGEIIKPLINPSAFRQSLEKAGILEKSQNEVKKTAIKNLIEGLE